MTVFLLEERSMAELLRGFLPVLIPGWVEEQDFRLIKHEGKADLEKSIPRKLRGWNIPASFVIMRDNDGGDCVALKRRLLSIAQEAGKSQIVVRIVCQNLESWYLGDPKALALAYSRPNIAKNVNKHEFQNPDDHANGDQIISRYIPEFSKGSCAKRIGPYLSPDQNTSKSFQAFCSGIKALDLVQRRNIDENPN